MNHSLLKPQIGPVQDFIAQARSTRDLWSGSYLLSWLMGHAIKIVLDQSAKNQLIFPSAQDQPLLRWLNQPQRNPPDSGAILTPNLPNLFLAEIAGDTDTAQQAAAAAGAVFDIDGVASEWDRICRECFRFLDSGPTQFSGEQRAMWDRQVRNHWQVAWQVWPMLDDQDAQTALKAIPPITPRGGTTTAWNATTGLTVIHEPPTTSHEPVPAGKPAHAERHW